MCICSRPHKFHLKNIWVYVFVIYHMYFEVHCMICVPAWNPLLVWWYWWWFNHSVYLLKHVNRWELLNTALYEERRFIWDPIKVRKKYSNVLLSFISVVFHHTWFMIYNCSWTSSHSTHSHCSYSSLQWTFVVLIIHIRHQERLLEKHD